MTDFNIVHQSSRTGTDIFPLLLDLKGNAKLIAGRNYEHNTASQKTKCRDQERERPLQDQGVQQSLHFLRDLCCKESKAAGIDSSGGLQEPQFNRN